MEGGHKKGNINAKFLVVHCEETRGVQIRREEQRSFLLLLFFSFAYILNRSKQNKTKEKQQRTFPNSMTSLLKEEEGDCAERDAKNRAREITSRFESRARDRGKKR